MGVSSRGRVNEGFSRERDVRKSLQEEESRIFVGSTMFHQKSKKKDAARGWPARIITTAVKYARYTVEADSTEHAQHSKTHEAARFFRMVRLGCSEPYLK